MGVSVTETQPLEGEDVFIGPLRVPRELRDAINALAEQNERTQAAEIRVALRKHVADADSPTR